jgi:predicted nucleotidyltransferase
VSDVNIYYVFICVKQRGLCNATLNATVFSIKEILPSVHVPSYEQVTSPQFERKGRFEYADTIIRERMADFCNSDLIYGAVLFGSASFGDTNPGSDRDMIVAYPDPVYETEIQTLEALHGVAKEVYRATSIPLEITCATLEQFREGEHLLNTPMLSWLRAQTMQFPNDVIGHDFIGDIADQRRPPRTDFTELEMWLSRAHHTLQKEYLQGHYFHPHDLLGQIYSAPHVATRKVIDALKSNKYESGALEVLTKEGIASSLYEIYDREQVISCRLYDEITDSAQVFYDKLIPNAADLNQEEYDQLIEAEIENNLPKAIHLLSRLQMIQRCTRAHMRLRVNGWEEHKIVSFTEGDEDEDGLPFLPRYLRAYMQPSDLNGNSLRR